MIKLSREVISVVSYKVAYLTLAHIVNMSARHVAWHPHLKEEASQTDQEIAAHDSQRSSGDSSPKKKGPSSPQTPTTPNITTTGPTNGPGPNSVPQRPHAPRQTSRLNVFRQQMQRGLSSNRFHHGHHGHHHRPAHGEGGPQPSVFARLARRARGWALKGSRRTSEAERLRHIEKSHLLFGELFIVTPTTMVLASQILSTEDRDDKIVPVLIQQISLKVEKPPSGDSYRNAVSVNVEYGSGNSTMKWSVIRGYRDFLWLRAKIKTDARMRNVKPPKLPKRRTHYEKHKMPYDNSQHNIADDGGDLSRIASLASSVSSVSLDGEPETYEEAMEKWLKATLRIFQLRTEINRVLAFLELSHMSVCLAPESSYHGKEGVLVIRSRAGEMGWRVHHLHPMDFALMIQRHTPKWVLVRESYLVVVDSISSTQVREVFQVDSSFEVVHVPEQSEVPLERVDNQQDATPAAVAAPETSKKMAKTAINLHLRNGSRDIKFTVVSDRELRRWQASILQMKRLTPWSRHHRFGSYAPVRHNVFGQWFVDARDYYWMLSEALENAQDTIFILDWWLSPELYLRRPPEGNQRWRLDRVLKRRAEAGVKIFVVVYRNVGAAIPIDSMWTKHSLLDLHENIHIIRSPNQLLQQNALFWAHHEKLCVIDNVVAFNGGIDLCFGRWDTWQHTLIDDAAVPFWTDEHSPPEPTQLIPGKDYSNPRVHDFFSLDKPFEDMYDRFTVPRMPWHDIHQMVMGQPARDLARHFVQRWNYVIRQKIPSRKTPFLLPPPDFTQAELDRLGLTGTCEYQALRSSCDWSLGLKEHEQSIQNAYLTLIQESERFVYIENQFFITSTEVDGIVVENQIGNALVQRIVKAYEAGEPWKAFILIPLTPGFEAQVDSNDASSVRVIYQCEYNSISRGAKSIFYRLESLGIRPDMYIHFFSLRQWGKFRDDLLTTEQLYIHAKTIIVDDRIAVIGSANINERSMRGVRDSEVAVCVRDTKVVDSSMGGKPWKAAKFAHSLRVRLMREHLGVDIDKLEIIERLMHTLENAAVTSYRVTPSSTPLDTPVPTRPGTPLKDGAPSPFPADNDFPSWLYPELHTFNWYAGTPYNRGIREHKKVSTDSRIQGNPAHKADVEGHGFDHMADRQEKPAILDATPPSNEKDENEARKIMQELLQDPEIDSKELFLKKFYSKFTGQNILRPVPSFGELPLPHVDDEGRRAIDCDSIPIDPWSLNDPLDDTFLHDKWFAAAERNTLIYRLVFRCQPDDEVETWKDYKKFQAHQERFYEKQREDGGPGGLRREGHHEPERVDKHVLAGDISHTNPEGLRTPDYSHHNSANDNSLNQMTPSTPPTSDTEYSTDLKPQQSVQRRPKPLTNRRGSHFEHVLDAQVAEDLLHGVTGHLVVFPTEWLNRELDSGNWNFQMDRMAPLEIYN